MVVGLADETGPMTGLVFELVVYDQAAQWVLVLAEPAAAMLLLGLVLTASTVLVLLELAKVLLELELIMGVLELDHGAHVPGMAAAVLTRPTVTPAADNFILTTRVAWWFGWLGTG